MAELYFLPLIGYQKFISNKLMQEYYHIPES